MCYEHTSDTTGERGLNEPEWESNGMQHSHRQILPHAVYLASLCPAWLCCGRHDLPMLYLKGFYLKNILLFIVVQEKQELLAKHLAQQSFIFLDYFWR